MGQRNIKSPTSISEQKTVSESRESFSENKATDFILFDPSKDSSDIIPDTSGNYIVCLKEDSELPDIGIDCDMKTYKGYNVVYTGIAGESLRKRYSQHFTGNNAGRSTLRKSLGSLFGYQKIARDKDASNGKTKFNVEDELKLTDWMKSNLILFFKSNSKPEKEEEALIESLNPPLNLEKNKNRINQLFRKKLSELRTA